MARKVIALNNEVQKAKEKLAEIERIKEEAVQEELNLIESVKTQIHTIAVNANVFVGVVLTRQDLLAILDIAMQSGENVKVPFQVYINE